MISCGFDINSRLVLDPTRARTHTPGPCLPTHTVIIRARYNAEHIGTD